MTRILYFAAGFLAFPLAAFVAALCIDERHLDVFGRPERGW